MLSDQDDALLAKPLDAIRRGAVVFRLRRSMLAASIFPEIMAMKLWLQEGDLEGV